MWAICRRDHGLTWTEFQDITLAQFEALEERRMIAVRHSRFNAALTASVVYNAHRGEDSEALSPFDFLPGFERDAEEEEAEKMRKSAKHAIAVAFSQMDGLSAHQVRVEKARMIHRMKLNGVEDPEELIREVFPDL
jgi:hypothetical protein